MCFVVLLCFILCCFVRRAVYLCSVYFYVSGVLCTLFFVVVSYYVLLGLTCCRLAFSLFWGVVFCCHVCWFVLLGVFGMLEFLLLLLFCACFVMCLCVSLFCVVWGVWAVFCLCFVFVVVVVFKT